LWVRGGGIGHGSRTSGFPQQQTHCCIATNRRWGPRLRDIPRRPHAPSPGLAAPPQLRISNWRRSVSELGRSALMDVSCGSGAAVPAASTSRLLCPPLRAFCCAAANWRSGPIPSLIAMQQFSGCPVYSNDLVRARQERLEIDKASAWAVVRLTTRSNFVGCSTGNSPSSPRVRFQD
jgi:hypothetical protein